MGKCRRGYSEAIAAVAEIDAAAIVQELKDLRQNDEDEATGDHGRNRETVAGGAPVGVNWGCPDAPNTSTSGGRRMALAGAGHRRYRSPAID